MFEFNANLVTGDQRISLPENWGQTKFDQYVQLVNNDDGDWLTRLSVLSGIDKDQLGKLPVHATDLLISIISFIADLKPLKDANVIPEKYKDFKYSTRIESTWHQEVLKELQKWSQHFKVDEATTPEEKDLRLRKVQLSSACKLVEVCTRIRTTDERIIPGWKINDEPVLNVIGMVNFFLHHLMIYLSGTQS